MTLYDYLTGNLVRTIYLVPVIHSQPDMGSASASLEAQALQALGEPAWREHLSVIDRSWKAIAGFCHTLDACRLQVYQDGLAAGGEAGAEIIRRGAGQGSPNYAIIAGLLGRGATLVATESRELLKEEQSHVAAVSGAASPRVLAEAVRKYRLAQARLLERRDSFIAHSISETLKERGILFIGAYHDVASRLPEDIHIAPVKEPGRVREYLRAVSRNQAGYARELARYLTAPVTPPR